MKVEHAIRTIELLGGYKLVRRYRYWNGDTNRSEVNYVFTSANGQWEHDAVFTCIRELRLHAAKLEALQA